MHKKKVPSATVLYWFLKDLGFYYNLPDLSRLFAIANTELFWLYSIQLCIVLSNPADLCM